MSGIWKYLPNNDASRMSSQAERLAGHASVFDAQRAHAARLAGKIATDEVIVETERRVLLPINYSPHGDGRETWPETLGLRLLEADRWVTADGRVYLRKAGKDEDGNPRAWLEREG